MSQKRTADEKDNLNKAEDTSPKPVSELTIMAGPNMGSEPTINLNGAPLGSGSKPAETGLPLRESARSEASTAPQNQEEKMLAVHRDRWRQKLRGAEHQAAGRMHDGETNGTMGNDGKNEARTGEA